ncbi:hypothetical protein D3C76_1511850 [compost metagenome]
MSSCAVTMIQARPWHLVARLSATVCRLVISLVFSAMYWPTSSMKKFRRKLAGCLSSQALTWLPKSSMETLYWVRYLSRIPLARVGSSPVICA